MGLCRCRGPVGSDIKLTILREGADAPIDIEITRAIIKIKAVKHRIEGNVGYIRLISFTEKTYNDLADAIVGEMQFQETLTGAQVSFQRYGASYLAEFMCKAPDTASRGSCISAEAAQQVR